MKGIIADVILSLGCICATFSFMIYDILTGSETIEFFEKFMIEFREKLKADK